MDPFPLRRGCLWTTLAAALLAASPAVAQVGGAGQGGLSPDTQVIAPEPAGPNIPGRGSADAPRPRTPLPPRDTPRAPQPGQSAGGDGPKTPLPPRDAPRGPQPGAQSAMPLHDPDWPCVQRKVAAMSYGQVWSGPPIDQYEDSWRQDTDVQRLVPILVSRRVSIETAKEEIGKLATLAGDKKNEKLTMLFAGVFQQINAERSHIVDGIERFARRQRALSERIKEQSLKIAAEQKTMEQQNSEEGQKQQQQLDWDTRIYDERSQSLTYVCETPVILEQRIFDLAREIQGAMN